MKKLLQIILSVLIEFCIYVDKWVRRESLNVPWLDKVYSQVRERLPKGRSTYNYFRVSYYRLHYTKIAVEDNTVFLDCFWGRKIGGNPYALYREILKDTSQEWQFIWVRNKGVSVPQDVLENKNVTFVEHSSIGYALGLAKAKYLVCNSNFLPFFVRKKEQLFINTWHGIPLKALGLDIDQSMSMSMNTQRNFNQATFIPMSSAWSAEKIVAAYGAHYGMNQVEFTGSPRIDLTLNTAQADVKKQLDIGVDKQIVLYAPTWRGSIGSVSEDINLQIDAIEVMQKNLPADAILYVSLHHLTRKAMGDLPSNIRYVPDDIDMNIFLAAVDVLVSDYSSIFIDYLVLNRPIILHVPDLEEYEEERGLLLDIKQLPVNLSFGCDGLLRALAEPVAPSEFESYEEYKELWLPNEDGFASKKCWEQAKIREFQLSPEGSDKKQILIYGGMLANNGITASLQNLLNSIDQQKYEVWLTFSARYIRHNSVLQEKLEALSKVANVVLSPWQSKMLFSEYLASALHKYALPIFLDFFAKKLAIYGEYEALKKYSYQHFDHYIDFTGYSYVQSLSAPFVFAKVRSIYMHSDMYEEWKNKDKKMGRLRAIFYDYKHYDYLVSVSAAVYEENRRKLANFVSSDASFVYVPNTIDGAGIIEKAQEPVADISQEAAEFLAAHKDAKVFVAVSRLSPEKNLSTLIRAFALALKENPTLALIIVGSGVEQDKLVRLTNELDLDQKICFVGFVENPFPFIMASNCLVFPSDYEGQGLVLLEALTLDKYCIATRMPATSEILEDGYGDLVDNSVAAFSASMLRFAKGGSKPKPFDYIGYANQAIERFDLLLEERL